MLINLKVLSTTALFLAFSSVLSALPRLGLSTTTVGPVIIQTGANGATQTVQAYNLGDGSLTLTATSSASWLSATIGAQTACAQAAAGCYPVSIALNTSSLAGGVYTEYLTLTSPGAIDAPQVITVTANTTGVPSSIATYLTPTGGSATTRTFPVFTAGTGVTGTVVTQSGGSWLQFINGLASPFPSPAPWLIAVNALAAMSPGTYVGTITISGSSVASDNKAITVTATVTTSPIISLATNATVQLTSYPGGPPQAYQVNLTNEAITTTVVATNAASSASFITAVVSSANTVQITANPGAMAAGLYTATVTVTSNAANNAQISIPVEFTLAPAGIPAVSFGGIVNAATFTSESLSQGDIGSIFGTQFAASGTLATNASTPLATSLAGTQVLVNNVAVPLYFVSPGQINFQVPYGLAAGQIATVQVMANGQPSNLRSIGVTPTAPRMLVFYTFIQGGYGVIVNNTDGSLTLPSGTNVKGFATHPAEPGDVLVIYAIGFGQTSPAAVEGQAATSSPLEMINNVSANFGGGEFSGTFVNVKAGFAGLTPTAVGLYQVNVTVPANTPFGNAVPLSVLINGVVSNTVYVAISSSGK